MAQAIAFLGLGVMGAPMAGHLARAGHSVTVYNRTTDKAAAWAERHRGEGLDVRQAATPAEAAAGQDAVLTCVGNDDDLAQVVLGPEGALAAMRESLDAAQVTAAHMESARARVRPSLDPAQVLWLATYAEQHATG